MATAWSEIVSNYAMLFIDDIRLTEQMKDNPALFFRRMSLYVGAAIPMISRPPELDSLLKSGRTDPDFTDVTWVSTEDSTQAETSIDTAFPGAELFACKTRTEDDNGEVFWIDAPEVTYDKDTGFVTFPQQEKAGIEYSVDLYIDGTFGTDLTDAQKRLLGMAVGIVWDERFSRNWLNLQMKIKDSSFDTVNESNYMRETGARLVTNRKLLNDELRKYEQDVAYSNTVTKRTGLKYV